MVEGAYKATDFFQFVGTGGTWLRFTAATIRDSNDNVIGALETLEDVTRERLAAVEAEE